jgi:hypothetical protein
MAITWGELKQFIEENEVHDDTEIDFIDIDTRSTNSIEVVVTEEGVQIFG